MNVPRTPATVLALLLTAAPPPAAAQAGEPSPPPQTSADGYTRYELGEPGSGAFRILYEVSATTPGATRYFNTIRAGAEEEVHGVTDRMTGEALEWSLVDGEEARRTGHPRASPEGLYLRVELARPVPEGGEVRILIDKTYVDRDSYFTDGGDVVFDRSLGVPRNAVVLPPGYELVSASYPSQVVRGDDGRLVVSFMKAGPASVPYVVRARPLPAAAARALAGGAGGSAGSPEGEALERRREAEAGTVPDGAAFARPGFEWSERAREDREIVYFPHQPSTHAFRLYHDYTETRPGVGRYLNVVRAGSSVSNPSARLLDTGEDLEVETLRGDEVVRRGVLPADRVGPETEVVVISFPSPGEGESRRLRIEETYTDPGRYLLAGDELLWDRGFGRSRNTVVLPPGWYVTHSALPAVVEETPDGRTALRYDNPRPDGLQVFIKARRREPDLRTGVSWTGVPLLPRAPTPEEAARLRATDRALAASPEDPERLLEAAAAREAVWRYDEAVELYRRAARLAPDDFRPPLGRGHRLVRLRAPEAALAELDRAVDTDPRGFNAAYLRGFTLYVLGRFGEAADEYVRCLRLADDPAAGGGPPGPTGEAAAARPGDPRHCAHAGTDPASRVALTAWAVRALRRAGRDDEAMRLLEALPREISADALDGPFPRYEGSPIVPGDNAHYWALLRHYRGDLDEDALLDRERWGPQWATVAYGVAAWRLAEGDEDGALALLEEIVEDPNWARLGHVAAEADLVRLTAGRPGR